MAETKSTRKKKSEIDKLGDRLLFKKKSAWEGIKKQEEKSLFKLSEEYKQFLNTSKTERQAMRSIAKLARTGQYIECEKVKRGDKKIFLSYDNVAGALAFINDPGGFEKGFLMIGAHIDSPRLDLKQYPLFEAEDMAYLKTHYYGGIKKYQWVTRPLALHGVVVLENGKTVDVAIGEEPNDPVFTINDLLPHLSQKQNKKSASTAIEGEQLNLLVGSIPYKFNPEKDAIKLSILNELNKKLGIVEQDFVSAELQAVPAGMARDVGIDRSFVGAHGQDDRICAYLALRAILELATENLKKNLLVVFFDKEEIGSMGNSGANSNLIERIVNDTMLSKGVHDYNVLIKALENSKFLSADVNAGIDPEWKDVNEPMNAGKIGFGVCLTKFTGSRGKSGSNEAHAEFVAEIRKAFSKDKVIWQNAELGKIDQGGGGTIAYHLARYGMDVIDCGPALLSMHSPFEISSKIDILHTLKAFKSFFNNL